MHCNVDKCVSFCIVTRIPATILITLITFVVGVGSAVNIDFLVNQVCANLIMHLK